MDVVAARKPLQTCMRAALGKDPPRNAEGFAPNVQDNNEALDVLMEASDCLEMF